MALKMSQREVDGVTVVALEGRIVLGEESNALREKVKSLLADGKKKIVLNLANVGYIDSAGLGTLVATLFLNLNPENLINVPEAPLANGIVLPDFMSVFGDQSLWLAAVASGVIARGGLAGGGAIRCRAAALPAPRAPQESASTASPPPHPRR